MTHTDEAVDLLESLWHEELKCEARHDWTGTSCSQVVTHRGIAKCSNRGWKNICRVEGVRSLMIIESRAGYCNDCGRDVEDCWSVRPI